MNRGNILLGVLLVVGGILLLTGRFFPFLHDLSAYWPVLLVIVGIVILARG